MGNAPARIKPVRPPRWVYVRFPRGAMFGEPANPGKQRKVLEGTLNAFAAIQEAGGKIELPHRWEPQPISLRGRQITEGPSARALETGHQYFRNGVGSFILPHRSHPPVSLS